MEIKFTMINLVFSNYLYNKGNIYKNQSLISFDLIVGGIVSKYMVYLSIMSKACFQLLLVEMTFGSMQKKYK